MSGFAAVICGRLKSPPYCIEKSIEVLIRHRARSVSRLRRAYARLSEFCTNNKGRHGGRATKTTAFELAKLLDAAAP